MRIMTRNPALVALLALGALGEEITGCRACPRLVAWREQVAAEKRAAFRDQEYWGRPVAGFGDPAAKILIFGLAPAAHGANRTGRVFTGDRSGDWLYAAMYRAGLASQPESFAIDDGLELDDAYVASAVRCAPPANAPTPGERDQCLGFAIRELALLRRVRVVVVLGAFAYAAFCKVLSASDVAVPRPRPKFAHGLEVPTDRATIVASFHPSQQNTFTGRLTETMLDSVFARAVALAGS